MGYFETRRAEIITMSKVSQEEREKRRQRLLKSNPNVKRWPKFKADALAAAMAGLGKVKGS